MPASEEAIESVLVCPDCKGGLKYEDNSWYCPSCSKDVGRVRDEFLDFMLDVKLDDDYQSFYEEEGTEADEEGGPRINAQKFKIPNVLEVLPSDLDVNSYLDMGCGGGWIMETLLPELEPNRSVGLDISETRLHEASRRNPNSDFIRTPVETVPLDDNTFDLITCLDVIEHLKNPSKVLQEARRLSSNLIIKFPIEDTLFDRFQKEFWWPLKRRTKAFLRNEKPEEHFEAHLHRFNFDDARSLLRNQGFRIVDENVILDPLTEGKSFMYPPAYGIRDDTPLLEKLDFYFKRTILQSMRILTRLILYPLYFRIFNSGIYFFCERR